MEDEPSANAPVLVERLTGDTQHVCRLARSEESADGLLAQKLFQPPSSGRLELLRDTVREEDSAASATDKILGVLDAIAADVRVRKRQRASLAPKQTPTLAALHRHSSSR